MTELAVKVSDVVKRVTVPEGELTLLTDIDFTIETGASLAVVGASGSGKSTLLGLMAGLDRPTSGHIVVHGTEITALDEDARAALRGRLMGFVFQSFQLLPSLTAEENVMLPLELAANANARDAARNVLERVGLSHRLHHYPKQLSGGEQQRVAIARAFATHPKLLLADEPTGSLDRHTGEKVGELLFELNREHGTTLVLVTHDDQLAARCSRQLRLDEGKLVAA